MSEQREVIGKIVAYDLPSENMTVYRHDRDAKNKARATRVYCTEKLHNLGLQCTESVILVSPSQMGRIDVVIGSANDRYRIMREYLEERGIIVDVEPLIEVIAITRNQRKQYRVLAERRLIERLNENIDRISRLVDSIDQITEEEKRRSLRYRLTQLNSEWKTIQGLAGELGISLTDTFQHLMDLIEEACRRSKDKEVT